MLRYLRSRIGGSYEVKNAVDDLDDFISYKKSASHGFPQRVSCFASSENNGLLAIGTRSGRLQIFAPDGSQISTNVGKSISGIYFTNIHNTLFLQCSDITKERTATHQFFLVKILQKRLDLTLFDQKMATSAERVTHCEVLNDGGDSALLLCTIMGNIHALWALASAEVTGGYLIFSETALSRVKELEHSQQRAINGMCIHPVERLKMFLLFGGSVVVLFDKLTDNLLGKFVATNRITSICVGSSSTFLLYSSHANGSFSELNFAKDGGDVVVEARNSFGEAECSKMSKILVSKSANTEEFVIFAGGLPEELEGRNTIALFCGDNSLILDFDSAVLDFEIFDEAGVAKALFVLCEEEFVAIDLLDPLWRMFPLPYLHPIHFSPVTCVAAFSEIPRQIASLFELLAQQRQNCSKIFSSNKWPLEGKFAEEFCGKREEKAEERTKNDFSLFVITGHENGTVCIWRANDLTFSLCLACKTAREFEGYRSDEGEEKSGAVGNGAVDNTNNSDKDEQQQKQQQSLEKKRGGGKEDVGGGDGQLPPIRKAGIFDPYSDDHRLCIQKICFDSISGQLAVGGQAGQLLVFETLMHETSVSPNQLLLLDFTSCRPLDEETSGTISPQKHKAESAIQPRGVQSNYLPGFCLYNNVIAQFKPPVPVTAISWNPSTGILAAGNEFGYTVCSIRDREVLLVRALMSSDDVLQISNKDSGALSRFKSVKKSIRQSFRRKKVPPSLSSTEINVNNKLNNTLAPRIHRHEREIVQRKQNPNALEGETPNSLIKVLSFKKCNIVPFSAHSETYLFVGTQGGSVLIHLVRPDSTGADQRCALIKEIRLQHQAPIVAIECLQQELPNNPRLIVFSEEQIRSFLMPSLKPFSLLKYRLTAVEGSRIRKAVVVSLNTKTRRIRPPEKFIAVTTNRGEVFVLSPTNPKKRPCKIAFVQANNTAGIISSVLTPGGDLFFLNPGGSEFDHCSINGISHHNDVVVANGIC